MRPHPIYHKNTSIPPRGLDTAEAADDTLPPLQADDAAAVAVGEVCLATTPEELEAVARFRYVVHVEKERNTRPGTDHANRLVWPTEPGIRSDFYASDADRRIVGCASLWMTLPRKEIAERLGLAQAIAKSRMPVAYLDTLTVAPDSLWSRRMARMLCRMYCFTREHGRVVGITHCNPVLASHYERLGLYRCGRPIVSDDFGLQIPMVLFLEDAGHFEKIGSLLLPYARHYENDPLQVARLKSDFDIRTPFFERTRRPLKPPAA